MHGPVGSGGESPGTGVDETVRNPLRVVYLMGYGRSGSTVLDTLLGQHPDALSLGELGPAMRLAFLDDEYCACGERASACAFWGPVLEHWRASGADPARYESLSRPLEAGRGPVLRALLGAAPQDAALRAWGPPTRALFGAIAAVSGKRVLIDSSKSPARAAALLRLGAAASSGQTDLANAGSSGGASATDPASPELEVYLVHLVRDGRGVAYSLAKSFAKDARAGVQEALAPRSISRTALAWRTVNAAARRVYDQHPAQRRLFLRYEDYVADPAAALEPLEAFIGPGLARIAASAASGGPLQPAHTIAGNRVRMQREIQLRPDVAWREHMSARERRRFWTLAGTSLARYGYGE